MRRRRITSVARFLGAMAVATAVTQLMTPKYESKAEIFISSDAQTLAENTSATTGVLYKISSYANLATHQEVLDRVSQKLDPPLSPDQLEGKVRSEEHTSELQSLMRISYAVFCLKKNKTNTNPNTTTTRQPHTH